MHARKKESGEKSDWNLRGSLSALLMQATCEIKEYTGDK